MASRKRKPATGNGKRRVLTKADIQAADDMRTERVHVPEWGGDVILRTLTSAQRDEWSTGLKDEKGEIRPMPHVRAMLVAVHLVNEDGTPMYTPAEVEELAAREAGVIDRLAEVCAQLTAPAERINEAVESAKGN